MVEIAADGEATSVGLTQVVGSIWLGYFYHFETPPCLRTVYLAQWSQPAISSANVQFFAVEFGVMGY